MDSASTERASDVVPQRINANTFTLENRRIHVSFSATSITGQPLVHYKDRQREVNARGDEIQVVESEIGTLVSILLHPDADAGALFFGVLIPRVALADNGAEQAVSTVGFLTRSLLNPPLAANLQLQTYDVESLKGTATFVVS